MSSPTPWFGGGFESSPVEDALVLVAVVDVSVLTVLVDEFVEELGEVDVVEVLPIVEVVVKGEELALEAEAVVAGELSWFA